MKPVHAYNFQPTIKFLSNRFELKTKKFHWMIRPCAMIYSEELVGELRLMAQNTWTHSETFITASLPMKPKQALSFLLDLLLPEKTTIYSSILRFPRLWTGRLFASKSKTVHRHSRYRILHTFPHDRASKAAEYETTAASRGAIMRNASQCTPENSYNNPHLFLYFVSLQRDGSIITCMS